MSERLYVLIVEDNPADVDLIREALPETGAVSFRIEAVTRLSEAIARLKSGGIDLILLDLGLPDSQGLETYHKMLEAAPHIALIIMTMNGDQEMAVAAAKEGAQDYLIKGEIRGSQLTRAVRYAVERKRLKDLLTESEERYRRLFETASDGIVLLEKREGKITHANPATEKVLGYTQKESIGNNLQDIGVLLDGGDFQTTLQNLNRIGISNYDDVPVKTKSGQHIDTDIYLVDRSTLVQCNIRDISQRKQADYALAESEKHYRMLFDSIDEGFCIIEVIFDENERPIDYRFLETNPSFEKQTGLIDARGKTMRELAPKHEEHWFEIYGKIAVTGQPARFMNRAEQLNRWFDVYAFRFGQPENRQVAILLNDITARKQNEKEIASLNAELEQRVMERTSQLEAVNQELEVFSHSVSHDLRAPLRSIDGFSKILMEDYADRPLDETGKNYLERIRQAIRRMSHLIEDLLKLSHITRKEIKSGPVDLSRKVKGLADKLRQETPDRIVEVVVEEGVMVSGDHSLLEIILENMLDNAWKFTGKTSHPRIEFGTTLKEAKTVCFLKDNGAGFDPTHADKLFRPFQRLHTTEEFPGTGIGLATVKRIITRHGGQI